MATEPLVSPLQALANHASLQKYNSGIVYSNYTRVRIESEEPRLYVPLDACIRQLRHTFQATTLSDNHLLIHESDLLELSVLTEEVVPSRPTLLSLPTSLAKLDSRYSALFRGESTGNRTGRDSEKSRKSYLSRYVKCKTSGAGSFPRIHMVESFSFIMHHVQKRLLATGILQFDRMRIGD